MRNLASVQTISKITPIEGKDRIALATIEGWQVIINKSEFTEGDSCVYIEIDSILPDIPEFEFIKKRSNNMRIRTLKMSGVVSQGLAITMKQATAIIYKLNPYYIRNIDWRNDNITDLLKITKYEEDEDNKIIDNEIKKSKNPLLRFAWYRKLFHKKTNTTFPPEISKSDETRIQSIPSQFEKWRDEKIPFSVTEKYDGCSATYILRVKKKWFGLIDGYEFVVASRNKTITYPDNSHYWQMAEKYDIKNRLISYVNSINCWDMDIKFIALQGEICGPGIQKNRLGLSEKELFIFNVNINGSKMENEFVRMVCNLLNIPVVKIIEPKFYLPDTIQELVEYVKGEYTDYPTHLREGCVFRGMNNSLISFKCINNDYLLKHGI